MNDEVRIRVNGRAISVPDGTVLAAALASAGLPWFRRSVDGHPRAPLCGMGICMECRVTINGQAHCCSCQTLCREGMTVQTDE